MIVVAVQYFHAHEVHKEAQSGMDKAVSMARRGVTLPPLLCDFEVSEIVILCIATAIFTNTSWSQMYGLHFKLSNIQTG